MEFTHFALKASILIKYGKLQLFRLQRMVRGMFGLGQVMGFKCWNQIPIRSQYIEIMPTTTFRWLITISIKFTSIGWEIFGLVPKTVLAC